jgi:hypothetical protein
MKALVAKLTAADFATSSRSPPLAAVTAAIVTQGGIPTKDPATDRTIGNGSLRTPSIVLPISLPRFSIPWPKSSKPSPISSIT